MDRPELPVPGSEAAGDRAGQHTAVVDELDGIAPAEMGRHPVGDGGLPEIDVEADLLEQLAAATRSG